MNCLSWMQQITLMIFFCTIGTKLFSDIPTTMDPPDTSENEYKVALSHDFIWTQDLEEGEVLKELDRLDVKKSSSFIEMNTQIFKITFKILI